MVTLPTRAYVEGQFEAVGGYGRFSTGFSLQEDMKSGYQR